MVTIKELARQALCIMVLDLEYSHEWPCTHGDTPIRHQLLWGWIRDAMGKDEMLVELGRLGADSDNVPIKTNPQIDLDAHARCVGPSRRGGVKCAVCGEKDYTGTLYAPPVDGTVWRDSPRVHPRCLPGTEYDRREGQCRIVNSE